MEKTGTTDDPNHPDLKRGVDTEPTEQHKTYLVLSKEERKKGFVRILRDVYVHNRGEKSCGGATRISNDIAETYARDPKFYGATYCIHCRKHLPVDEFSWDKDGSIVGS